MSVSFACIAFDSSLASRDTLSWATQDHYLPPPTHSSVDSYAAAVGSTMPPHSETAEWQYSQMDTFYFFVIVSYPDDQHSVLSVLVQVNVV